MRNRRRILATAIPFLLGASTLLAVQPEPGRPYDRNEPCPPPPPGSRVAQPDPGQRPPPPPTPGMLARAGVTEDKIKALAEFEYDQQQKRIDLRAAAEKAELTLQHLMQAAAPDEKAVMAAVDAVNAARSELLKLEITSQLKFKNIVGEEALRKLREQAPTPPRSEAPERGRVQSPADRGPRDNPPQPPRSREE
jgi:hypothetical protein